MKIFMYRRLNVPQIIISLVSILVLFMIGLAYLSEIMRAEELATKMLNGALIVILLFLALTIVMENIITLLGLERNVITDDSLILKRPLRTRRIFWLDILEFGTYTKNGFNQPNRFFYLKVKSHPEKAFDVCDEYLPDIGEFIDLIFLKAINAHFVIVDNITWIPFMRRTKLLTWERYDKSFLD